ncbi:NlpC/P60 family protein [Actinomadura luteofluorescens]|uniref:NlpC/P60 family protein n=1 Tax=Actinomadura luteofluorescens TaxID=46163 RepID=UPI00347F9DDC
MRADHDRGGATIVLVVGMTLLLVAATMLVGRLAFSSDLRGRAQVAADAAALAAVQPLREYALELALAGVDPRGAAFWDVGEDTAGERAARYAGLNGASLVGPVRLSGLRGRTARVSVATRDCKVTSPVPEAGAPGPEESTNPSEPPPAPGATASPSPTRTRLCRDRFGERGLGRSGTATAAARLDLPSCARVQGSAGVPRLLCDGVRAWPDGDRTEVGRRFRANLVDADDPERYGGEPDGAVPNPPPGTPPAAARVLAETYRRIGPGTGPCTELAARPPRGDDASRKEFDERWRRAACDGSGFVREVHRLAGLEIPDGAGAQRAYGAPVRPGEETAADLVFFRGEDGRPDRVGIVLDPAARTYAEFTGDGRARIAGYGAPGTAGAPAAFTRPAQHR